MKLFRFLVVEFLNSMYDYFLFIKYSFKDLKFKTKNQITSYLIKQYHIIEKALSLPETRKGFGEAKIRSLIKVTNKYIENYGYDELTGTIFSTIKEYIEFHKDIESNDFINELSEYIFDKKLNEEGGVKKYEKTNLNEEEFIKFLKTRTSVRYFSNSSVDNSILYKAVDIAKQTPSLCNRQGWKVHFYEGKKILELLKLQNGNRGFTESVQRLAIMTGDYNAVTKSERNEVGTGVGMFSMTFVLALHSLGLASCILNSSVSFYTEKKIKRLGKIPSNEKIVMFIAIGYPHENAFVAKSHRKNTNSVISFHK